MSPSGTTLPIEKMSDQAGGHVLTQVIADTSMHVVPKMVAVGKIQMAREIAYVEAIKRFIV